MRVLVTGSRDWDDYDAVEKALFNIEEDWTTLPTLVSGGCPTGADRMAEGIASNLRWDLEVYPADWEAYGRRAGFVRNAEMVKLGADVCLAFIKGNSRGATMTADLAEKAGIPVIRFTKG